MLLAVVLRRARDVMLTMLPVLLSGLLTFATCGVLDLPLNFTNIIALPLLFGVGVAFNIYFVHGVARRRDGDADVEPDARRDLQRAHDRHGLRRPVAVEPSRHCQHGPAADDLAGLGASRHPPVPAGPAGALAAEATMVFRVAADWHATTVAARPSIARSPNAQMPR